MRPRPSRNGAARGLALALLVASALPLAAGCSGTDAGLLTINGPDNLGLRHFVIDLKTEDSLHSDEIKAPASEGAPIKLPATVSFTFSSSIQGFITVHVVGYAGTEQLAVGDGFNQSPIAKGGVTPITVTLTPSAATPGDGGTGDGGARDLAPGGG